MFCTFHADSRLDNASYTHKVSPTCPPKHRGAINREKPTSPQLYQRTTGNCGMLRAKEIVFAREKPPNWFSSAKGKP